ncbi:chromosome segregation protein SMC [Micrococcus terreus]|uniref:chromosome segregation protein SMC n=1 Tax=Micrococcus terreus TaxID=574650 RepID=UPI00301B54D2
MFLKTLTVRGFKSFASATTFHFEPGVTAVVGPNGSGKSNVVDALAWVMGEQGAKNLRGGKMEDVIFAGTSGRAPLGRAQVTLTIDNADGALPIEYSEVTISRTLFRSGGSEYAINGASCRLLDIQELLSDSGLGRQMHVIVGQGQLDRILQATPEERRGFIEEASGILKHRRRKERTVRKLESMRANLDRVRDLTEEVRRQLGPLSRQAATARKAQRIQFDVRDARARLLADDLTTQRAAVGKLAEGDRDLEAALAQAQARLAEGERQAASLGSQAQSVSDAAAAAQRHWYELSTLAERYRSLAAVVEERVGSRRHPAPAPRGPDPQTARALAERAQQEAEQADAAVEQVRAELEQATAQRQAAEATARQAHEAYTRALQRIADRRQAAAVAAGRAEAARARQESLTAQDARLAQRAEDSAQTVERLRAELTAEQNRLAGSMDTEEALDDAYEQAAEQAAQAQQEHAALQAQVAEAEAAHREATARREALQELLEPEADAAISALTDHSVRSLAERVRISQGWEAAVAAALGGPGEQLVLPHVQAVESALQALEAAGATAVRLLHPLPDVPDDGPAPPADTSPGVPAASVVETDDPGLTATLRLLLDEVVLVEDLEQAREVVSGVGGESARRRAVTRDGAVHGPGWFDAQGTGAGSRIERQAAADRAAEVTVQTSHELDRLRFAQAGLRERLQAAQEAEALALEELNASDARYTAVTEHLARLTEQLQLAQDEGASLAAEREALARRLEEYQDVVTEAERQAEEAARSVAGESASAAPTDGAETSPVDSAERDAAEEAASQARHAETEARLALRTAESVQGQTRHRADQARRAVAAADLARTEYERSETQRRTRLRRLEAVGAAVGQARSWLDAAVTRAAADRQELDREREQLERRLNELRQAADEDRSGVAQAQERLHAAQMARQEQQLRLDQMQERAREDLGMTPDYLLEHFGPEVPVPTGPPPEPHEGSAADAGSDQVVVPAGEPETVPFDRAEQQKRLRRAERELSALGRVNPLALEEFDAVEERHRFLSEQLQDLESSRKDLLAIIQDVDDTVLTVFRSAFEDTAEQFQHVFATLFPGGEGRLFLTDPDDLLSSGVEVEARPAGKKVKRLSLLSGGERSLAAVAMLVAIFKARPSPFYVMDEVEAALDDTNLGRLLQIFRELQRDSQLIIITHQKRTMEVADALYGVSMRGDGISQVISQRLDGAADPPGDPGE